MATKNTDQEITPDTPKQTSRRKLTETPEKSSSDDHPETKRHKPAEECGFTMGAMADSDDEMYYPTVEQNNLEPTTSKPQVHHNPEKEK